MARPFIEFIQCQALPWQRGLYGGARPELDVRMLSMDEETGASSALLRYPGGWARNEPERLGADEELFVLRGELRIGQTLYGPYSYAYLPAGYERPSASSRSGAVVVSFFSAEPSVTSDTMDEAAPQRMVSKVDALEGPWTGNFHPDFPPGAGRKWLKQDPLSGEQTWVLGTLPLRSGRRPERHPVVEELFLISGMLAGPLGTMYPGAYFWRPPHEWHGPFGTLTGNVELFRTIGGPLSTEYADQDVEFSFEPEYRPILPADEHEAQASYKSLLPSYLALGPQIFEME
ncbi:MAG: DUF4437 domain-containing protein [Actinobacteria bacterium]|nr:DUF4437 domain-containing protein [Actinomycetota bacterium]